jgi:tRNA-dihydrouridine synthase A
MNGLLKGDPHRFLTFDASEHPVALQLGGSDPEGLAQAARIGEDWGYDEINLNVGCPSDRVSSGHFGACLMAEPDLVADCVSAMAEAVSVPVTVKCRIGIDDMDIEEPLNTFVSGIVDAGCQAVIVHARKAWLKGLSPAENRTVPPLDYGRVYRLKSNFPDLTVVINGGITDMNATEAHLQSVDGVMMGRAAYETPYVLAEVDHRLFGLDSPLPSRVEIAQSYVAYCEREVNQGTSLHHLTKHILGLFKGCPGARAWRRFLSTNAYKADAQASLILDALNFVESERKVA